MKEVQQALRDIGIPVFAGIWRATSADQNPPQQYIVYSTTLVESAHADDRATGYRTFVYLNLWSDFDPTSMRNKIRKAMYDYGFSIREESDKGYNHPAYDPPTRQYTIQWTWVWYEEVPPDADDS